ncbi:hypothetical protein CO666_21375 [Rhizobium chutanense]|uniref:Type I restriction modification DNA specificity domain-containing protein n=1 Tax=Rhizobium chutanense TaxID=2035448 RepID=A0A2A6J7Z1_9HYPH|nr:restriction endonuclease subunit S [Rhizobium chutanense]PDT02111.1 hypothetical protein CO666_21375 [Rhizobium chutanense]
MSVRTALLEDVCEINPRAPKNLNDETPVSFLPMSAVSEGGYVAFEEARTYGEVKKGYTYFERGDVLIAKITPCFENGKAASTATIQNKLGFGSTEFHVLRPSHHLDPKYAFYLLWSDRFRTIGEKGMTGSAGQKRVPADLLRRLEIPLPPVDEQKRIAAILDKADQLRQKRRQALALLDSLSQSIFQDLFGDLVSNPMGWETQTVEDFCELIVDCVNRTAPLAERPTDFKMIRTTNVKKGRLLLSEVRYVDEEIFAKWNRRATPQFGDVILTREAPVGEVGILDVPGNFFLGQRLMLYRPDLKKITSEYMLHSFQSKFLSEQFRQGSSGSTVKHLPLPACRSFAFRVPPIEIQQQFSKRVATIKRSLGGIEVMTLGMDEVFSSLQHRAFSGQL